MRRKYDEQKRRKRKNRQMEYSKSEKTKIGRKMKKELINNLEINEKIEKWKK